MARKKRKVPAMNATSSADIAFMLLIFFLITTSMDTDKGLARRLPPPVPKDQKKNDVDVNKRNLLVVLINSSNQILCGDQFVDIKQLKTRLKSSSRIRTMMRISPKKQKRTFLSSEK